MELVNKSTVQLIKTNATDEDVAHAAWVSNFAEGAQTRDTSNIDKLIGFLYRNKHMSPFEHGSFTWFIDTPMGVSREFMRHRTGSYNETSTRYKTITARFYVPPVERPLIQEGKIGHYNFVPGSDDDYDFVAESYRWAYAEAWDMYQGMLDAGIAREVARNVLPLGTMTQFYVTMNPRNVMQFLDLRAEDQALYEIRQVAYAMEKDFASTMPLTYDAWKEGR